MGYESATSTILLASQCAVCSRPLVDSVSVETGMGPVCREKHGYTVEASDENREQANKLIHAVASAQTMTPQQSAELTALGFERLAMVLAERLMKAGRVVIESNDQGYSVKAPYSEDANNAWRQVVGQRWNGADKTRTVPTSSRRALWALLKAHYAGAVLQSSQGETIIS